jgi:hypothetical protein
VTPDMIKRFYISYGILLNLSYRNLSDLTFVHLNDKCKETGVNIPIPGRFMKIPELWLRMDIINAPLTLLHFF